MRAGTSCGVQQTLTSEAASVLKHSLSLARRRGHAQVTSLHVAATLLSSRLSLLRSACLKSQPPHHHQASHPPQCRALELCFNVALNRLPTTPGPLLHGQPSLSNALVAALKRAQAHQRRGCIEQQQQPFLVVKVELEHLVLSILDDPSVSRVMREAGFSSTAVKNSLEDCSVATVFQCHNSSGGIYSTPSSPPSGNPKDFLSPNSIWNTPYLFSCSSEKNPLVISPRKKVLNHPSTEISSVKEDTKLVIDVLLTKKKRNAVVVGDLVSQTEGIIAELMGKVEKGDVPKELQLAYFIKFHFSSAPLRFMKREEVELNVSDLRKKVDTLASNGKGVIIYTGDLKWIFENVGEGDENGLSSEENSGYSPVDHLVGEIGRLVSCYSNSNANVWLVATANYQTYIRSQMKQPSLDMVWALQAVPVPSGGLGLSLKAASFHDTNTATLSQVMDQKAFGAKGEQDEFNCSPECESNHEKVAANDIELSSNELPYWLKQPGRNMAEKVNAADLKRKWNKVCVSLHQGILNQNHANSVFGNQYSPGKNYNYGSYPWRPSCNSMFLDSKSISFSNENLKTNQTISSVPRFRRQQSCHVEFHSSNGTSTGTEEPNTVDLLKCCREDRHVKTALALGNSPISDSENCAEESTEDAAAMCKFLQENVPWQSGTIPLIVEALMNSKIMKKDAWLVIQGNDRIGKRRLALGIAESIVGSSKCLVSINLRMKENIPGNSSEMLENALGNHGRQVFFLEDVDFADAGFLEFLADGFGAGKLVTSSKKDGGLCHHIFILTKSDSARHWEDRRKMASVIHMEIMVNIRPSYPGALLYSDRKSKPEWDVENKSKIPRKKETKNAHEIQVEKRQKESTGHSSSRSPTLDLNMKAEEEEECGEKAKDLSPISSDLTSNHQQNPLGFLDLINSHFIFDRDSTQDKQISQMFLSKIRGSFEDVFGTTNLGCFSVDQNVLDEISLNSGTFLNTMFEKWLKVVFETSLKRVNLDKKLDGINFTLSLSRDGESDLNSGFKGSCLPEDVSISYLD